MASVLNLDAMLNTYLHHTYNTFKLLTYTLVSSQPVTDYQTEVIAANHRHEIEVESGTEHFLSAPLNGDFVP